MAAEAAQGSFHLTKELQNRRYRATEPWILRFQAVWLLQKRWGRQETSPQSDRDLPAVQHGYPLYIRLPCLEWKRGVFRLLQGHGTEYRKPSLDRPKLPPMPDSKKPSRHVDEPETGAALMDCQPGAEQARQLAGSAVMHSGNALG